MGPRVKNIDYTIELIYIKFKSLESDKEIIISAIVVRTDRDEEGKNIYGIRYYNIENKIREKIDCIIFSLILFSIL